MPPTPKIARVNGIELSYEDAGSGPLVVMVMGTGSPGRVWKAHQQPALVKAGHRVVTFDNRGIAPSSECAGGFALSDMVADTAALIEYLGAGPAAVMGATVLGQPILGAVVGVVLSCLVFIMEVSRPVVRRQLTCTHLASKRIRSQHERSVLDRHGRRIVVFDLQGVLFFGNADDLAGAIQKLPTDTTTIVLDLRRVSDLDTSGATVLRQIARRCREHGIGLVLSHPDPSYDPLLREALADEPDVATFPDLDAALEDAEERILARFRRGIGWRDLEVHETDLGGGLSAADLAALKTRLTQRRFAAGEMLCRAGESADRLWILARGSVSVRVSGAHYDRRIAGLGPGTTVGEMGLLDRRPRSADVVADEDVEAYMLTAEDFDALLREEKRLGQSLLATIARLTAQRLRDTSEELRLAEG